MSSENIEAVSRAKRNKDSSSEEEEDQKVKRQYIASIVGGLPGPKNLSQNLSKGTIKRRIVELIIVSKEWETTFEGKLERPILEFRNSRKVDGIPNKIFLLVITTIMTNFDVSWIVIDARVGEGGDVMWHHVCRAF